MNVAVNQVYDTEISSDYNINVNFKEEKTDTQLCNSSFFGILLC